MKSLLEEISQARHVSIVVNTENLCVASALYTYILTLHKKVSLVCKEEHVAYKYSFLPWYEKIKTSDSPSADLTIALEILAVELYEFFQSKGISINKKMATALYAGILSDTQGFHPNHINGINFAVSSDMIKFHADYKLVHKHMTDFTTLSSLRLKSRMLENMLLVEDARVALFTLSTEDLKFSGASLAEALENTKEAFLLPFVESVILLDSERNDVVKIIDKEI